jgi:hypothetical protein
MLLSCENINMTNPVPNVPVNYTLNIEREYPHFMVEHYRVITITRTKFEREYIGYAGLLIWKGWDGNFHAADLCCPNCLLKNKPLTINDEYDWYATCPTCGEAYELTYGYAIPTKGLTKFPLKKYPTSFSHGALRIININ